MLDFILLAIAGACLYFAGYIKAIADREEERKEHRINWINVD